VIGVARTGGPIARHQLVDMQAILDAPSNASAKSRGGHTRRLKWPIDLRPQAGPKGHSTAS
jgi:hypothetical protein